MWHALQSPPGDYGWRRNRRRGPPSTRLRRWCQEPKYYEVIQSLGGEGPGMSQSEASMDSEQKLEAYPGGGRCNQYSIYTARDRRSRQDYALAITEAAGNMNNQARNE